MNLPSVLGVPRRLGQSSGKFANMGPVGGGPPASAAVSVRIPRQIQTNWCWAAVTEGIWNYYDRANSKQQCEVARLSLGHSPAQQCCCKGKSECNRPYYLDVSLKVADCYASRANSAVPATDILSEIKADHPVGIRIQWPSELGHFVVASAIEGLVAGGYKVTLQDPWGPKTHWQLYDDLKSNYDSKGGRWTHTYLTNAPSGGSSASTRSHLTAFVPLPLGG